MALMFLVMLGLDDGAQPKVVVPYFLTVPTIATGSPLVIGGVPMT